jgi:hypothetical protein
LWNASILWRKAGPPNFAVLLFAGASPLAAK